MQTVLKTTMGWVLGALLALAAGAPALSCGSSEPEAPEGEAADAGARLAHTAEPARVSEVQRAASTAYAVSANAAAELHAPNPAHGFTARLSAEDVRVAPAGGSERAAAWALELSTIRFGCSGATREVEATQPTAEHNRVEYARSGFVEWYLNGPLGLEQGYTVPAPPCAGGLVIETHLGGTLTPRSSGGEITLHDARGRSVLRYAGLAAWDADGKALPARLSLAQRTARIEVDSAGARYPITIDPYVATADTTLQPSDDTGGSSGTAIAGNTAIVGNGGHVHTGYTRGAAWIFTRSGSTWSEQQELLLTNSLVLGRAVAVSGDTAAVTAGDSVACPSCGDVYVFVRSGTTWNQQGRLPGVPDLDFGADVDIDGDIVVASGPLYAANNYFTTDRAFVFERSGTTWGSSKLIRATDTVLEDDFGRHPAVSGTTVVVSAPLDDDNGTDAGAAYVFTRNGSVWSQQAKLLASDGVAGDTFGGYVDVDGDTAVVTGSGPAYVFTRTGTSWAQSARLTERGDLSQVALSGDVIVARSVGENVAFVFRRVGTSWTSVAELPGSSEVAVDGETALVGKRVYTLPCTLDAHCPSTGQCVDNYCCDTACDGPCDECASLKGTCVPMAAGLPGNPSCSPSLCDGTSATCSTTCTADGDCAADGYCDGSACQSKKARGDACGRPEECTSGFCADGVCCDSTCGAECDACAAALTGGSNGTCQLRLINTAPDTTCNGYLCNGSSTACPTSCAGDLDCTADHYCSSSRVCVPRKAQGSGCDTTSDCAQAGCRACASGYCVDGFCCDTSCSGSCGACSVAAGGSSDGTCTPFAAGNPGSPSCAPEVCDGTSIACPGQCAADSDCSGSNYCASDQTCKPGKVVGSQCNPLAGADCLNANCGVCQSGFCADGVCCQSACDGACEACSAAAKGSGLDGECAAVADGTDPDGSCSPYVCQSGACATTCASDSECAGTQVCITATGQCVGNAGNGTACSYDEECTSGFCVDGYCCNSACTGQCEACDEAGSEGSCSAVVGEPHGSRNACAGTAGECGGSCDGGNRAQCTYPAAGTACGTPSCSAGAAETHACNGQGTCAAQPAEQCNPYTCSSDGTCNTACSDDTQCASGFVCSDVGECVPAKGKCLDDHTFESSDGVPSDCDPYICTAGACKDSCDDSSHCLAGYVCDTGKKSCVPAEPEQSSDEGSCGCRVPGSRSRGSGLLVIAALLVPLMRWRRHSLSR